MAPGGGALPGDPSADANRMVPAPSPWVMRIPVPMVPLAPWRHQSHWIMQTRVASHPSLLNVLSLKSFQTTQTQTEAGACVSSLLNSTLILVQYTNVVFVVVSLCFLFLFQFFSLESDIMSSVKSW